MASNSAGQKPTLETEQPDTPPLEEPPSNSPTDWTIVPPEQPDIPMAPAGDAKETSLCGSLNDFLMWIGDFLIESIPCSIVTIYFSLLKTLHSSCVCSYYPFFVFFTKNRWCSCLSLVFCISEINAKLKKDKALFIGISSNSWSSLSESLFQIENWYKWSWWESILSSQLAKYLEVSKINYVNASWQSIWGFPR